MPTVGGRFSLNRFGFRLIEDNSLAAGTAYFFHPDFMLLALQTQPTLKISDMHAQGYFRYKISADCVFGAVQHNDEMVIKVTTA
jgi:hypothetical protein